MYVCLCTHWYAYMYMCVCVCVCARARARYWNINYVVNILGCVIGQNALVRLYSTLELSVIMDKRPELVSLTNCSEEIAIRRQCVRTFAHGRRYNSSVSTRERERELFYLTTHSTHFFIYGYMASDIWLRTILIVRKETRSRHIGYSYRLTARVILYAPSHRQDNTYHGLCYTSRG